MQYLIAIFSTFFYYRDGTQAQCTKRKVEDGLPAVSPLVNPPKAAFVVLPTQAPSTAVVNTPAMVAPVSSGYKVTPLAAKNTMVGSKVEPLAAPTTESVPQNKVFRFSALFYLFYTSFLFSNGTEAVVLEGGSGSSLRKLNFQSRNRHEIE